MKIVAKAALGVVAAVMLGGAAQASDLSITIRTGEAGAHRFVADHDDDGYGREHRWSERRRFDRDDDRFDRFERRGARDWAPAYGRPVFARGGWDPRHEDCRIIVKRRVNPWGDVVVKRTKICR
ncbi:MAG TPA: hypothetical protein VGU45_01845 [Microvirga sp.]|jgi:hypothetical protein|nr:hypothetical protein [Microvirga sp.]